MREKLEGGVASAAVPAGPTQPQAVPTGPTPPQAAPTVINGTPGYDTLVGTSGDDIMNGKAADDTLTGAGGSDIFVGSVGGGWDTVTDFDPQNDFIDASGGTFQVSLQSGTSLLINVGGTQFILPSVSIEDFRPSRILNLAPGVAPVVHQLTPGNDVYTGGNSAPEEILGLGGNDALTGGNLGDWIYGGADEDTVNGGGGNDYVFGGAGDDVVSGGAGTDGVYGGAGNDVLTGGTGRDNLYGGDGDDILTQDGDGDLLVGEAGDDEYFVGGFNPRIGEGAGGGFDTVHMSGGDIRITNVNIEHIIAEGPDLERVDGNDGANIITVAGTGAFPFNVTVDAKGGNDVIHGGYDEGTAEILIGGAGDDVIHSGGGLEDWLYGDTGNDILYGGGVTRVATGASFGGNEGDDQIYGSVYGDGISGHEGDDLLSGGLGDDVLDGGEGADLFVVSLNGGHDVIEGDFTRGVDRIDVSAYGAYQSIVAAGANAVLVTFAPGVTLRIPVALALFSDHAFIGLTSPSPYFQQLGTPGNDTLTGGVWRDHLVGGAGLDILNGLESDDWLQGEGDNDTLNGGLGQDHLEGGDGADVVHGNEGVDHIEGGLGADTLYGERGDDLLEGGDDADKLYPGIGNDAVYGGAGDDILNDDFAGQPGGPFLTDEDHFYGGAGLDRVNGNQGNDVIDGGDDNDTLNGGVGDDAIFGGQGFDRLYGGEHNDDLDGGTGDDYVYGGNGTDTLVGGAGIDRLYGDAGDDVIDGGTEADTVYAGDGADQLSGGDGADKLTAEAGEDLLVGGAGADILNGGDDADRLEGGADNDNLTGGLGADIFVLTAGGGADTIMDFELGVDRIDVTLFGGYLSITQSGVYALITFGGGVTLKLKDIAPAALITTSFIGLSFNLIQGTASPETLNGGAGQDHIVALDGADTVNGLGGDDWLEGGDGADILAGGAGSDQLAGGAGADVFKAEAGGGADVVDDFTVGTDKLDVTAFGAWVGVTQQGADALVTVAAGVTFLLRSVSAGAVTDTSFIGLTPPVPYNEISGTAGVETINGTAAADHIQGLAGNDVLRGLGAGDWLEGGAGIDNLYGGDGVDTLAGGDELDRLYGDAGNDILRGEAGNDLLTGGAGADLMTGGAGNDQFVFTAFTDFSVGSLDRVLDFAAGDKINLQALDADSITAGNQAFTVVANFTNVAGQVRTSYNAGFNETLVELDVNGDGVADHALIVVGNPVLAWIL